MAGGPEEGKTGPDFPVQAAEGGHGQVEGVRPQGQGGLRMAVEDTGDAGPTAQGQDRTGQGGVFLRRQVLLPEEDGPGSGPGDVLQAGEKGGGAQGTACLLYTSRCV